MDTEYFGAAVNAMRERGIQFARGLSASQVATAERTHGFRFPPDLRDLLQQALPIGDRFPDWRSPSSAFILDRLAWPADSICFDVEHNDFWLDEWGQRPPALASAQAKAREAVRSAPFLIPVYGHRYLPARPCEDGNPVFSVYQADVIYYGFDLPSYLSAEFEVPNPYPAPDLPREIEFWSDLVRCNR